MGCCKHWRLAYRTRASLLHILYSTASDDWGSRFRQNQIREEARVKKSAAVPPPRRDSGEWSTERGETARGTIIARLYFAPFSACVAGCRANTNTRRAAQSAPRPNNDRATSSSENNNIMIWRGAPTHQQPGNEPFARNNYEAIQATKAPRNRFDECIYINKLAC